MKFDYPLPIDSESRTIAAFLNFHKELGFPLIKEVQHRCPDLILEDENGKEVKIEVEYFSSSAKEHDPTNYDLLVCWVHDWDKPSRAIIELSQFIKEPSARKTVRYWCPYCGNLVDVKKDCLKTWRYHSPKGGSTFTAIMYRCPKKKCGKKFRVVEKSRVA